MPKRKALKVEVPGAFDIDRAVELARLGATDKEIITILGCQPRNLTVEHRKTLRRHRAERQVRLKAKLFEMALGGSAQATLYLVREQDKSQEPAKPADRQLTQTRRQPVARFVLKNEEPKQPLPLE